MGWAAGGSPHPAPAAPLPPLLLLFFLFFKLTLLWGLSCLYENKNNQKASATAQPLPEALQALWGLSLAPPACQ